MTQENGWTGMGIVPGAAGNGIALPSGRLLIPAHSGHWGTTGGSGAGVGALYSGTGSSWSLSKTPAA